MSRKFRTPHGDQVQYFTKDDYLLFDLKGNIVGHAGTRKNATRIIQALNAFDRARTRKGKKS